MVAVDFSLGQPMKEQLFEFSFILNKINKNDIRWFYRVQMLTDFSYKLKMLIISFWVKDNGGLVSKLNP
jgi:hypothetical protein